MCTGTQLLAQSFATAPGRAAAANLRRGRASCQRRAFGRPIDASPAAAFLPSDRAAEGSSHHHGPWSAHGSAEPAPHALAAAGKPVAEHALAAHAGGAQHQRPLLHGSTHGSSATAHGHSNGLHVLSPMHDTLDSSMFLHGMQLTGPGCNGIDPVCQLDLRCDPVDTLQQLRSCLSAHGSAMLLVQDGRPNLLLDAVSLLHLLNQDLRLEEDFSTAVMFQPMLSSDLAAQGHKAPHAGQPGAPSPGAAGSFHAAASRGGGVTASGHGGIRVDSSSMALRVTKLRAPGLLQQLPTSVVAYTAPSPLGGSAPPSSPSSAPLSPPPQGGSASPRHHHGASSSHGVSSSKPNGATTVHSPFHSGGSTNRRGTGGGTGSGRHSPYASIPRSSTMDEVWGITDQIVERLDSHAMTQLRCTSPRSLVVAFRAIKRARKLLQLAGDWDLLVSPHIINDKVCFNCWRSQAGSLEGPGST